jgi:hypothetical protein
MMRVSLSSLTSTHDVLPPYRPFPSSGVGVVPRTPQSLTFMVHHLAASGIRHRKKQIGGWQAKRHVSVLIQGGWQ